MTALIVIGVILLVLILLAFLRLGTLAVYNAEGWMIKLVVGPVKIKLIPSKRRKSSRENEPEKNERKKGNLKQFKEFVRPAVEAGKCLKRGIRIDRLYLHYTAAGAEDPAKAAITFGSGSAAIGMLLPVLENNFDLRKRDIIADVDFTAVEPGIYFEAELTMAVWRIIYIASGFLSSYLKLKKQKKEEKAV